MRKPSISFAAIVCGVTSCRAASTRGGGASSNVDTSPYQEAQNGQQQKEASLVVHHRELQLTTNVDENMSDIWDPFDATKHTPYFWQIPKAGSTNALAYFTICMDLTEASRVGLTSRTNNLEIINIDGHNFVNVDVSTPVGIKHAHQLELPASGMADIVSSAYAYNIFEELFDRDHQGKMFAIFRHPIERLASKFYYLQTATHERSYNPKFEHMTIEQYAKLPQYVGNNWMTRMLVDKMESPLEPTDLDMAKEIIRRKCLVGLTSHMDESLDRFEHYFGWQTKDTHRGDHFQSGPDCKNSFFHPESADLGTQFNTHAHPTVERESKAWDLLAEAALYDLELYWYAVEIFMEQEKMFSSQ